MNILITGANGQLGNELQLLAEGHHEYACFFTDVKELDVCDAKAVEEYVSSKAIDVIVNCAAFTNVEKAELKENRALCEKLNGLAPQYLAAAAEKVGASLIQISTDYVFNGHHYAPYREDEPTQPISEYGRTKLMGEVGAMEACPRTVIIRTAWLYSPFGNNFVKTMLRLGKEKEEMGVVFDQIGTPTYARDLAEAIFAVIGHGIVPGIYHFSDEGVCSWYDFTKSIFRLAGISSCKVKPLHTEEYTTLAQRPAYSVLDKAKIRRTFGIDIPHWEESLQHCLSRMEEAQK